ncbi:MAG: carotenoid oxygenase family protein, partial [Halothece sp.]
HIEGDLPEDIQGHFFMVAPVGSIDSGGLPHPSRDSLINGDGMIYRLDFNQLGKVNLKTKLVKPADYYADEATQLDSKYAQYRFHNHGLARFSRYLGIRNQLNTAFLPMPFSSDSPQRLLVTYDAGRPYEIDTETLETVTPVGGNAEWQAETQGLSFPFQPILSTAHPAFDGYTGETFTVNYGRSVENFLKTIPLTFEVQELPQEVEELAATVTGFFSAELIRNVLDSFYSLFDNVSDEIAETIEVLSGIKLENFVYLIRWDGQNNLERWKVVLPDGSPIKIKQTIHQIGISQDYVVLMDTAFIAGLEQVINNPFPSNKKLERLLRQLLEKPANPDSVIYIVRRQDLKRGQCPKLGESEVEVAAQKLTIPLEAAHFLMDYENPGDKITLHIAHICAWNVAEWIHPYDVSAYQGNQLVSKRIHSMESSEMDISRFGHYVIDAEKGELVKSQTIYESPLTWGPGLYAYLDRLPSGLPPSRLKNIYWVCFGLWPELITEYGVNLYENYKYRAVSITEVLELAKQGVPSYLLRLDTTEMKIVDYYQVPEGIAISSPQFIPRQSSQGGSTDGYLLCSVFKAENSEFWLFDAENLSQGPLCQLSHRDLNFGYSLHTTWLPTIGPREASYQIPVASDYQSLVNQQSDPMIKELFYEKIYPMFSDNSRE